MLRNAALGSIGLGLMGGSVSAADGESLLEQLIAGPAPANKTMAGVPFEKRETVRVAIVGTGLRGTTTVKVTVSGGQITSIEVESYQDDSQYFNRAQSTVISEILSSQSINVSTVSGATFSSNGILEAVADALNISFTNPNSSLPSGGHGH